MDLIEILKNIPKEYSSVPFWSWNNELCEEELVRQMDEMLAADIHGFIIHARTGLKEEYLGERWFSLIGLCLEYARKNDMQVWIYDENGWPSGFAGGKLLEREDFRAQYLTYKTLDYYDESAYCVYALNGEDCARIICGAHDTPPADGQYHTVYLHTDMSNTDILNTDVTDAFIKETHEKYYARFSDSFGKELAGFFTDEPQYYRWATPYARSAVKAYGDEYGCDIRDGLIWLFLSGGESAELFRTRYYGILNKLLVNNFYKRIYDWCVSHGCMLTGHTIEECRPSAQMMGCAGVMPTYQYEHIVGIDWLARHTDCGIAPAQAYSVAAQTGKKFVLTETFGCSGWDVTPRDLKRITDFQYVHGVNKMCQHLTSYSLKGQGKNDHPPSFSRHNLWYNDGYSEFNTYYKRLGRLLADSREETDTLVISPVKSVYVNYDRSGSSQKVRDIDDKFAEIIEDIERHGLSYHIGDEDIMQKYASAENGELKVGLCRYKQVIVPYSYSLTASTYKLLKAFSECGGRLYFANEVTLTDGMKETKPLTSNIDYGALFENNEHKPYADEVSSAVYTRRILGNTVFYYLVNTDAHKAVKLSMKAPYRILDISSLTYEKGAKELTIPAGQSALIVSDESAEWGKTLSEKRVCEISDCMKFVSSALNTLTVDYVAVGCDGFNYEQETFIHDLNEQLIKSDYKGDLWLRRRFTATVIPPSATLLFEKTDLRQLRINGNDIDLGSIEQSDWDICFQSVNITSYLRRGENVIEQKIYYFQQPAVRYALYDPNVTESIKNCLTIDTEIESVYITGEFDVDEHNRITPKNANVGIKSLEKNGYRFFNGKITFEGEFESDFSRAMLVLEGRYMTADVEVNGHAFKLVTADYADISKYLVKSVKNRLRITLTSSPRNMMGPHHFCGGDTEYAVSPPCFTMYGGWKEHKNPLFDSSYSLVPFGLDKVKIIELQ